MSAAGPAGHPRRRPGPARWFLAGLLLVPLVEIVVAVAVAHRIGAGWTLLALAVLSLAGVVVLRRAARAAWRTLGPQVVPGGGAPVAPAGPASTARGADLGLEVAGGVLLAVPGFVTSVLGALLVLPPTRRVVRPLLGAAATGLVARAIRRRPGRVVAGETVDVRVVEVRDLDAPGAPSTGPVRPALPGEVVDRRPDQE